MYPDQIVYKSDGFGNLGAGCSFMQLLSSIDSDYYMFCDQDDVWMEDKIERTYLYLRSLEQKYSENQDYDYPLSKVMALKLSN